jgi:hypothetical protein
VLDGAAMRRWRVLMQKVEGKWNTLRASRPTPQCAHRGLLYNSSPAFNNTI